MAVQVRIAACLLLALFAGCGGGGGSSGTGPPSGLKYPTPPPFTVGTAVTPLAPTYSGSNVTFSITPALSAGLTMDANGVIGGTPTAEAPVTAYTVTAANAGGSTSVVLTLTVNLPPPVVSYGGSSILLTTAQHVHLVPTNTGGAVASWSISPALPGGLTFSTTDGSISGTVTTPAAPTAYTVKATNSGGTDTVALSLNLAQVLLDLGHATSITHLGMTATRVLAVDLFNHWALWNYASGSKITGGSVVCGPNNCDPDLPIHLEDIAGSTFAVQVAGGVELRATTDGSLLTTLAVPADTWQLASDGSYLCSASTTGLTAWGLDGHAIATRAGDYTQASLLCAPQAMRVANGPAGPQVIETITLASGTSAVGPMFQGRFAGWFADGGAFVTDLGNTVWVYSAATAQLDVRQLASFIGVAGEGSWFWTWDNGGTLSIYKVGASATPALIVAGIGTPFSSGPTIATSTASEKGEHIIDLSQSTPVDAVYPLPVSPATHGLNAYAAVSAQQWMFASDQGVLIDGTTLAGTPRYFGHGAPLGLVGGATQLALATASGTTFLYDATTWSQERSLAALTGLAMSADGSVLAARGFDGTNYFVTTYTLPGATPLHTWTYPPASSLQTFDVSLSADGTTLVQVLGQVSAPTFTAQVSGVASGTPLWSTILTTVPYNLGSPWQPVRLSPDGSHWTTSDGRQSNATTNIYSGGTFVTTLQGWAQCWLANDSLLEVEYSGLHEVSIDYSDSKLYHASGTLIGSVPLPAQFGYGLNDPAVQVLAADSLYQPATNTIWTISTGQPSWAGPVPSPYAHAGAVAGGRVVYLADNQIVMQPQ